MSFLRHLAAFAIALNLALGAIIPQVGTRSDERNRSCSNGPLTRDCWHDGLSIATDAETKFPTTGNTVYQTLEITNTTCNPDGSGPRPCMLVNGQYPGPTIRASWGDKLEITVKNRLQHNGTSIHWHGLRQYHNPGSDGVNGITQCAIAPGDEATYSFQATQYGTSWYHSHTSIQYGDGVLGPIVIEGPASANYDTDLGPYMFFEVYGTSTARQAGWQARNKTQAWGGPPKATNLLINGTNVNADGGGKYNTVTIQKGKKYLLRLINSSVNTYVRVSLDAHLFNVIASDFVPIKPFKAETLLLAIGQRYDVVIGADQIPGSYWFRAKVSALCYSNTARNGSAIWSYGQWNTSVPPTSSPWPNEPLNCDDQLVSTYWKGEVPSASFSNTLTANRTHAVATPGGNTMVAWVLDKPIWTNYSDPTIGYAIRGDSNYPELFNTIEAARQGQWNYWLIVNDPRQSLPFAIPHPVHLHGHDFFIIGSGSGPFDEATANLNWKNPVRRDTASLPGAGWLALAFKSDNPGTWLMHCHVAFHIAEGFGVQYIEAPGQIKLQDPATYQQTCDRWVEYDKTAIYRYDDSGL
ncbi:multicopper oxidase [Zasmidium cellare ATCC 36951]|uniref:laccase n=1 Tax=Zasmidium cellare ATCC 36951 TaxID=1080233 RepID=A0A6A6D2E0_ZASCE|nr:multicopper oxidase [Zasmidium cellare ATCC 36951]KAF2173541.1 multicopper oxidase [Zasmidium cellare ATCC 36951]